VSAIEPAAESRVVFVTSVTPLEVPPGPLWADASSTFADLERSATAEQAASAVTARRAGKRS